MSDTRWVRNDLKRGKGEMSTSSSIAAEEAFKFLNAGTRHQYRGAGDTATAARDRAARDAGITPAQGERIWKRWRTMASVDGDVYRALRNRYERLCESIEQKADALEAKRLARTNHEAFQSRQETDQGDGAGRM